MFLIRIPKDANTEMLQVSEMGAIREHPAHIVSLFSPSAGESQVQQVDLEARTYFIFGDFIIPPEKRHQKAAYLNQFFQTFVPKQLQETQGNFYLIERSSEAGTISVFNSPMSVLPVYYYDGGDAYWIASRMDSIIQACKHTFRINRKYILEHLLFGYGFLQNTLYTGINLLPTNHFIEIKGAILRCVAHTQIRDFYVAHPRPWRAAVEPLSDFFIERAANYIPESPYFSSLTDGFDGRTLLAIGLSLGRQITTYSYGIPEDKDMAIPKSVSEKMGITYQAFILDEQFAREAFLYHARMADRLAEGNLRFSRASYHFLAERLSRQTQYILSGNFGSELMRTLRGAGNVISPAVFNLFEAKTDAALEAKLTHSPRFRYLNLNSLRQEMNELVSDCITYRNGMDQSLTFNQNFYSYVLEEVFRKYFGAEIVLEHQYLVNRTPFLDIAYIKELFKTELAGCNGDYKSNNPFERFKGQVIYAYIMKKTCPELLSYQLDRGYAPGDFLSSAGKIRIALGYLYNKYASHKNGRNIPSYYEQLFALNIDKLAQVKSDHPFIESSTWGAAFEHDTWIKDPINFNIHISFFDYLHYILNTFHNVELG